MKASIYLLAATHKGKLSKYRSFLHHTFKVYKYISKLLHGNSNKDKVFYFLLDKDAQQKHYQRVLDSYNKNIARKKMNRDISNSDYNDDSVSSFIMNKIMGAYKTTKESPYVKSLYQETSSVFNSFDNQSAAAAATSNIVDALPENTRITLYPNYCKHVRNKNDEYVVRVKGVVTATGLMSRKNRFLLSMARRISKSTEVNSVDPNQLENEYQSVITNQDSYKSRDDESLISTTSSTLPDDLVKCRMEGLLAKTIPGTQLTVTIGSDEPVDRLSGAKMTTDDFGIFDISVTTKYVPSYIAVSLVLDPSILQTIPLEIVDQKGVSVITDIDDTIRLTGVLGDKREVFRNIFAKPYSSCAIPGVVQWFKELHDTYKCPIHYVSNSPWQVFNVVYGFMSYFDFPISSIHLRQYSGNLLASFTQPSAERKRPSLVALLNDFPDRRFILVGDTGEQDLEAYLSLIPQFAPQIMAIYLRVVPTSLSSIGNDSNALKELRKMLVQRNAKKASLGNKIKVDNFLNNPTGIDSEDDSDHECSVVSKAWADSKNNVRTGQQQIQKHTRRRSSIDLAKNAFNAAANTAVGISKVKKLAPLVPNKPLALRGVKLAKVDEKNAETMIVEPKPTVTRSTKSSGDSINNVLKPPTAYDDHMGFSGSESDDSIEYDTLNSDGQYVEDKRFNLWKDKIRRIINEVPEHITVQFWEDAETVHKDSIQRVINEIK